MKSAYELAMERLEKNKPTISLSDEQKRELAEVESTYKAKLAEKELLLRGEIEKAQSTGNFEEAEQLEKQLAAETARYAIAAKRRRKKLRASFGT